jgi:hypothetical protein
MSELESGSGASASSTPVSTSSAGGSASQTASTSSSSPSGASEGAKSSSAAPSGQPTSLSALKQMAEKKISGETEKPTAPTLGGAEQTAPVVPPAYTPNFKFKYLDAELNKQVEKEMDEWVRGYIKDAETEQKFQKLYAKAHGLDAAVQSREKHKGEALSLRQEIGDTRKSLNVLSGYVQNGDMQSFFEALKIPEDKVLKYAYERMQYRELSPEQRAAYDGQRDIAAKAQFLEEQNQSMAQHMQSIAVQTRESELSQTLNDPQVAQVAQSFDQRVGMPGAFRNEVIRRGQLYWHQFQKDIPAHQAVNEVLHLMGGLPQPQQAPAPQQEAPTAHPNVSSPQGTAALGSHPTPEARRPIIPNIQGSGASPAKKIPRSISDLKKLAQSMNA